MFIYNNNKYYYKTFQILYTYITLYTFYKMSVALDNVLVVQKKMDLDVVDNPKNAVYIGPTNQSLFIYPASSASSQNIIFNNICAPSLSTVMGRTLRVAMSVSVNTTYVTLTGVGGQFNAINGTVGVAGASVAIVGNGVNGKATACLRASPLANIISSADVRLNGGSTSVALNQYSTIYPFLRSNEDIKRFGAEMPSQCDNGAVYENLSATNPFNSVNGNSSVPSRGSFLATLNSTAVNGLNTLNTYIIEWTEELLISPFLTGHWQDDVGLCNVNNLTISLRLDDLVNMFSCITSGGIVSATINGIPNLLVEFNSQNSILAARTPQTAVYEYHQIQTYIRSVGTLTGSLTVNDAGTTTGDSIRLPCLPSKIYLFIAPTTKLPHVPDHFVNITGVSINFNDKTGLLNSMNESSLYKMSAFNAGSMSGSAYPNFNQYRFGCGSLIIIDVEKNLSVAESSQPGSQNQYSTFQATMRYSTKNLCAVGSGALDYTFYQVIVSPGKAFVSASQCEFAVLGPSPSEVLALTGSDNKVAEQDLEGKEGAPVDGAGFMEHLSRFGSTVAGLAAKHLKPEHLQMAGKYLHGKLTGGKGGAISGGAMHRRAHGGDIDMG